MAKVDSKRRRLMQTLMIAIRQMQIKIVIRIKSTKEITPNTLLFAAAYSAIIDTKNVEFCYALLLRTVSVTS
jgi:hypothetical protein